jgi:hypothetical protein
MFMPEHQRTRRQDGIAGRVARVEVEAGRGTVSNANAGWRKRKSSGVRIEILYRMTLKDARGATSGGKSAERQ